MDDKRNTPPAGTPNGGNQEDKGGQGDQTKDKNTGGNNGDGGDGAKPKTFTEEEHQADLDRIAAKTREEEKRKTERAVEKAKADAKAEAERLAKLDEAERATELSKAKERELQEWQDNLTMEKNRNEVMKRLSESKISNLELAGPITSLDLDESLKAADNLIKSIQDEVESQIKERLKGKTQKDVTNNSGAGSAEVIRDF